MSEVNDYMFFKSVINREDKYLYGVCKLIDELIDVGDIQYIYPKNWVNPSKDFQLIMITENKIYIGNIISGIIYLSSYSKTQIRTIVISRVTEYHYQLNICFDDKNNLELSNIDDANGNWQGSYLEYIKDIFKLLNKP